MSRKKNVARISSQDWRSNRFTRLNALERASVQPPPPKKTKQTKKVSFHVRNRWPRSSIPELDVPGRFIRSFRFPNFPKKTVQIPQKMKKKQFYVDSLQCLDFERFTRYSLTWSSVYSCFVRWVDSQLETFCIPPEIKFVVAIFLVANLVVPYQIFEWKKSLSKAPENVLLKSTELDRWLRKWFVLIFLCNTFTEKKPNKHNQPKGGKPSLNCAFFFFLSVSPSIFLSLSFSPFRIGDAGAAVHGAAESDAGQREMRQRAGRRPQRRRRRQEQEPLRRQAIAARLRLLKSKTSNRPNPPEKVGAVLLLLLLLLPLPPPQVVSFVARRAPVETTAVTVEIGLVSATTNGRNSC